MSRGLGDRQKEILRIMGEAIPEGKMVEIRAIYSKLKAHIYPELQYYRAHYFPYDKYTIGKQLTPEYWEREHKLNRARTSISNSVAGLVKRGYVGKERVFKETKPPGFMELIVYEAQGEVEPKGRDIYETYIYITEKGRAILKA